MNGLPYKQVGPTSGYGVVVMHVQLQKCVFPIAPSNRISLRTKRIVDQGVLKD